MTAEAIHARQTRYVEEVTKRGFDYGLTVADAFVRSIRSLGYKHCGTALDELIDNAIEAGAQHVHVAFGYETSEAKPTALATIDDGAGMVSAMLRAAVAWGGTDREASSAGFGRFGYGLPSASVSQGRRFSVFSRTTTGSFRCVTMDVDEISDGKYVEDGRVAIPRPKVEKLPAWVSDYIEAKFPGGAAAVRTVVVWDKIDRLTWRTAGALERNLLQHFGVTYRRYLRTTAITVNGSAVEAIDPLFITPAARFYDLDDERAEAFTPLKIKVKGEDGKLRGTVTLRISYMSPTFFRKDKTKKATGKNANARFSVRKDHNGIIVCRLGRQLDVTTRSPLTTFVNNDRSIGLEIDFPPALDDEFGVTTAKQQVSISDRIWELLREQGFMRELETLRRRYKEEAADADSGFDLDDGRTRPSEVMIEEIEGRPSERSSAASTAADNLDRQVKRLSKQTGVSPADIKAAKLAEAKARPYKVDRESHPEGPFYRLEAVGEQHVLFLNTAHLFFTDIYAAVEGPTGARLRTAIELLLFVLGNCELDAEGSGRFWYASERVEWSKRLNAALSKLDDHLEASPDEPEVQDHAG